MKKPVHLFNIVLAELVVLAAALGVIVSQSANGSTPSTLNPSADTYVQANEPHQNHGHAWALRGSLKEYRSYLKFKTGVIDDNAVIDHATLSIWTTANDGAATEWQLQRVNSNWTEYGTTWKSRPHLGAILDRTRPAATGWTALTVPTWAIHKDGTTSFGLRAFGDTGRLSAGSRESSKPPRLIISYRPKKPHPTPTTTPSTTPRPSPSTSPTPTKSPTPTPTPPPPTTSSPPPGGGTVPPAVDAGWTRIIDDRFDSGGVPTHWSLYDAPYGSGPGNCAAPSQDFVQNGSLVLLMSYLQSGRCGAGWYTGGMQITKAYGGIDQTMTVRMRVVSSDPTNVRSHRNVPMRWVDDPNYQWYQGESDYCEGSSATGCTTFLHYGSSSQVSHDHTFDVSQWHTFKVVHQNNRVRIYIDGVLSWDYQGTTTTVPNAFRRAVLQQECRSSCPSSSYAGQTERIEIDYVTIDNPTTAISGGAAQGQLPVGGK